ncbi:MAG: hypothetical protein JSS27_12245 [Planctomycetes bacterium]|nr:hypothetical protein [Planctomycetota bacterium]
MQFGKFFAIVAACLIAFGLFQAAGTYFMAGNANWSRPLLVMACVLGFLAFWGVMLAARRARLRRQGPRRLGPKDAC